MILTATILRVDEGKETKIQATTYEDFVNCLFNIMDEHTVVSKITKEYNDINLEECMEFVFNNTDPGEDFNEETAAEYLRLCKDTGIEIPDMMTPELFVELYNDLDYEEEDD